MIINHHEWLLLLIHHTWSLLTPSISWPTKSLGVPSSGPSQPPSPACGKRQVLREACPAPTSDGKLDRVFFSARFSGKSKTKHFNGEKTTEILYRMAFSVDKILYKIRTQIAFQYLSIGISMGTASKKCDVPLPCLNSRKYFFSQA